MTRANYDQLLEDARSGRSIAVVLWRGQSLETATDHLVATGKHLDLVVRATAMMFTAGMATDDDGLRWSVTDLKDQEAKAAEEALENQKRMAGSSVTAWLDRRIIQQRENVIASLGKSGAYGVDIADAIAKGVRSVAWDLMTELWQRGRLRQSPDDVVAEVPLPDGHRAYLQVRLFPDGSEIGLELRIMSDRHPTLAGPDDGLWCVVAEANGPTYQEAEEALLSSLLNRWKWIVGFVDQGPQTALGELRDVFDALASEVAKLTAGYNEQVEKVAWLQARLDGELLEREAMAQKIHEYEARMKRAAFVLHGHVEHLPTTRTANEAEMVDLLATKANPPVMQSEAPAPDPSALPEVRARARESVEELRRKAQAIIDGVKGVVGNAPGTIAPDDPTTAVPRNGTGDLPMRKIEP